jgi:hypothetical protein
LKLAYIKPSKYRRQPRRRLGCWPGCREGSRRSRRRLKLALAPKTRPFARWPRYSLRTLCRSLTLRPIRTTVMAWRPTRSGRRRSRSVLVLSAAHDDLDASRSPPRALDAHLSTDRVCSMPSDRRKSSPLRSRATSTRRCSPSRHRPVPSCPERPSRWQPPPPRRPARQPTAAASQAPQRLLTLRSRRQVVSGIRGPLSCVGEPSLRSPHPWR